MGFRTVIISSRAKLETRLNYLVVRGEGEKKIFIDEINTIIVQSTAVSLTAALLNTLMKKNVKVIFCDEKCNPSSELLPYYTAHNTSKRYKMQMAWKKEMKEKVWREIIRRKIIEQSKVLGELGYGEQSQMLEEYAREICLNDSSNREGHAAKVYFNCIFNGKGSRQSGGFFNGCLNYGYTVLVAAFNREIVAGGYLTQLGIWHDNEFNEFNLACDLVEPFRVVVDRAALAIPEDDECFKKKLVAIFGYRTDIDGKHTTFDVAIRIYTKSVFRALEEENADLILFPENIEEDFEE